MAWGNGIAAAGTAVEIIGFAILAIELRNANTSALVETTMLRSKPKAADTILISDGDDGGIDLTGGRLGALLDSFNQRQNELTKSKRLIFHGLIWAGIGLVVQLLGSLLQCFNL